MKNIISVLLAITCAVAHATQSQSAIQIESDKAYYQPRLHQAIHEGNVVMKQDSQILKADKLIIERNKVGKLSQLTATGHPATFSGQLEAHKTPVYASANTIHYFPDKQLLMLEGNATLMHEQDKFKGPVLSYQIDKQVVNASKQSNERPTLFIQPRASLWKTLLCHPELRDLHDF